MVQLVKRKTGDRKVASLRLIAGGVTLLCLRASVMSSSKTLYPLVSTGSTQEDRKSSQHDQKSVART